MKGTFSFGGTNLDGKETIVNETANPGSVASAWDFLCETMEEYRRLKYAEFTAKSLSGEYTLSLKITRN